MNTKLLVFILVVIFIGAGFYFVNNNALDPQTNETETLNTQEPQPAAEPQTEDPQEVMATKGSYELYSPEKIERANEGKVVLFFRASWCPTCRGLDKNIKATLDAIPSDVTILDVDYDTSTALKQRYGITYQHTLVQVDGSGNQIAKWTGSPTLADLLTHLK